MRDGLTYTVQAKPLVSGGPLKKVARLQCYRCPAVVEITMPPDNHNPEWVVKKFRERGWLADKEVRRRCLCPACQTKRKPAAPAAPLVADQQKMEMIKMTGNTSGTVRDLTPAEKSKVRSLLDQHFDDDRGCYIDGYSDQKIGEELSLPWAAVTKIREAAFGEIRVDPELAGLRDDLAAIRNAFDLRDKDITKMLADFDARLGRAEQRFLQQTRRTVTDKAV